MAAILRGGRFSLPGLSSDPTGRAKLKATRWKLEAPPPIGFGGDGQFANPPGDPITLNGVPYRTKLRVWEERSGMLVREFWSNADGTWKTTHLSRSCRYIVVCYNGEYPALAYDRQTPDPMT
jgi:hypothetical protein